MPLSLATVVVGLGLKLKRLAVLAVGVGLFTSALSVRAVEGLLSVPASTFEGEATLVGDPRWYGPSLRVDLRIDGHRVEAWARGPQAARLASRLMGERVTVAGRVTPVPADAPWLTRRHITGRLSVNRVDGWRPGDPVTRAANGLRRTLAEGAEVLAPTTRALYAGLLLGDQRHQGPIVADDFRGSGLTHLLAVSGQNVAYVLVIVGPLLARMRLTPRLLATLAVLAFFALVTRFEPSVMRATAMAGCAAVAVTFGREADSRRMLAVAVVVLLLVDPLIARQLAFQLSVAATTGILLFSNRLAAAIPGPRTLATAVAVTVSAQLAVAPLLVPIFGGMPVAALVANVLAAPATGPVVVWGLPAGLAAGVVGGSVAEWLHRPTGVLVGWIARVAEFGAALPLGEIRTPHLLVMGVGAAAVALGRSFKGSVTTDRSWNGLVAAARSAGCLLIVAALAHPAVALAVRTPSLTVFSDGSRLHTQGRAVILELDRGARPEILLEALRRAGVARVDVVVARHGGRDVAEAVAAIGERVRPRLVLAPRGHRVPGGSVAVAGSEVTVGGLTIWIEQVDDQSLEAVVSARDP